MFPDCTAPATAVPAAELPTDQLILAKMNEAAASVSVNFRFRLCSLFCQQRLAVLR